MNSPPTSSGRPYFSRSTPPRTLDRKTPRLKRRQLASWCALFHAHVERNRSDRATMVRTLTRRASLPAIARDLSLARASHRVRGRDAGSFLEASPTAGIAGFFRTGRAPSRAPTRTGDGGTRVTSRQDCPFSHGSRDPHVWLPVRELAGGSWPSQRRRHRALSAVALRGGTAMRRRAVHRRGLGVATARSDSRRGVPDHFSCHSRAVTRASRSNPRVPASPRAFPRALPETLKLHHAPASRRS